MGAHSLAFYCSVVSSINCRGARRRTRHTFFFFFFFFFYGPEHKNTRRIVRRGDMRCVSRKDITTCASFGRLPGVSYVRPRLLSGSVYICPLEITHTHTDTHNVSLPPVRTIIDSTVKWRHLASPLLHRRRFY